MVADPIPHTTTASIAGYLTRSRTAFALIAATLLVGCSVTEASAKSRHHRHHHHHHAKAPASNWQDANASIGSQGSGRSFSGKASFYGNESGSKTASGQRFNQNAMTAAHKSAVRNQAPRHPWRPERRGHD